MVNCAVVGLGIGLAHCAGYMQYPDARLYGVCDLIPERLSHVGGTFDSGSMLVLKHLFSGADLKKKWEDLGVKTYNCLEDLLKEPKIDCVSLCTPDYTHSELGIKILASGKHLLLEKPVDITEEKAEHIIREASGSGLLVSVAYEFRINPVILALKGLVESGELGRVEGFSLYHFRSPFKKDKWNKWIQKKELSGGLLVEETCHWFDLAEYITGKEIKNIHCVKTGGIHSEFDFEDLAYVNGTYKEGGIFQISHALTGFDFSLIINLHGTKGTAWGSLKEEALSSLDNFSTSYYGLTAFGKLNASPSEARVKTYGREAAEPENIRQFAAGFAEAVNNKLGPVCSLSEGLRSLRAAIAAGVSAEEGRIVEL